VPSRAHRSIPQRIAERAEKFGDKADARANVGVPFLYALAGIVVGIPISGKVVFGVSAPWWPYVVAAILLLVALLWHRVQIAWRKDVASKETAAAADVAEQIGARHARLVLALAEVATTMARMPDMSKQERLAEFSRLVTQLVRVPVLLTHRDVPGVRAVVYEVVDDDAGNKRMVPVDHAKDGRRGDPAPFTLDNPRGRLAFERLEVGEPLFVDDIAGAPPGMWDGSGRDYNTFITTPITDGTTGYGLFTVDAPKTDDLTESDQNDFMLIAGFLAIIFAERDRKTPGRQPSSSGS
jgi:hypothetical protein